MNSKPYKILIYMSTYKEDGRDEEERAAEGEEPDVVRRLVPEGMQLELTRVPIEDEDVDEDLGGELTTVEHRSEDPPEL
jgi:hypothetical protein